MRRKARASGVIGYNSARLTPVLTIGFPADEHASHLFCPERCARARHSAAVWYWAFLRNRQAHLAASVDLMKALGGGWSADPAQVSRATAKDAGGK